MWQQWFSVCTNAAFLLPIFALSIYKDAPRWRHAQCLRLVFLLLIAISTLYHIDADLLPVYGHHGALGRADIWSAVNTALVAFMPLELALFACAWSPTTSWTTRALAAAAVLASSLWDRAWWLPNAAGAVFLLLPLTRLPWPCSAGRRIALCLFALCIVAACYVYMCGRALAEPVNAVIHGVWHVFSATAVTIWLLAFMPPQQFVPL